MIDVRNLTYTYRGSAHAAVRDMTFAVERNEIFGFLGPSGAGKSTTQRILIGLLRGYGGTVTVFGRDLARWGADYYARIGVSFELPNHFSKLTALENLTYFRALYSEHGPSPLQLLEKVGLADSAGLLVSQYSKGMKNRLSVARALLHDPEVLFLDEPTSGLDPVNARRIKDLIREQQQAGKTIFLTTHNMAVAEELCDRVAFIVDGQVKLIDAPRRLKIQYGRATVQVETSGDGRDPIRREFPLAELGQNPEFMMLLRDQYVETLHTQEATLEDIFIQVTGREL